MPFGGCFFRALSNGILIDAWRFGWNLELPHSEYYGNTANPEISENDEERREYFAYLQELTILHILLDPMNWAKVNSFWVSLWILNCTRLWCVHLHPMFEIWYGVRRKKNAKTQSNVCSAVCFRLNCQFVVESNKCAHVQLVFTGSNDPKASSLM